MDPGGKRVRTDSPSTGSQRDGPKTRKSAKRDSKSSENSEVGMRFEAQNPQIRNLHRTPRRRKLRAQRAHGRNPIGKRAAGWLHGNSPKGTSRIENRSRAKRAPPKPRDGTLPKKQSRLAQGKTGGAENPKRSLLRIRPWAREIRAEPAEHGAKTPAGMAAALRKKRTCLPLRQGETYRDRSDGRGCFQRDTRSDGTEERNGQRQAGRGPYSMSSVRRMSQDAKSEAQEQERNHKRKRLPFPAMEKATFFLCSSKG